MTGTIYHNRNLVQDALIIDSINTTIISATRSLFKQ